MRVSSGVWLTATAAALAVCLWMPALVAAQPPGAAFPRAADGHPDFSGIWQVLNTANFDIQDHAAQKGVPAGQGVVEGNEIPYTPAGLAKKMENAKKRATVAVARKLAVLLHRLLLSGQPYEPLRQSPLQAAA